VVVIALQNGISADIAHIIAYHAREGDGAKHSPEAAIVNKVDMMNFDSIRSHLGTYKRLLLCIAVVPIMEGECIMSNVGFRIFTKVRRPSKDLVEGFRGLPVANIADEMNRFSCVDARIKPINNVPLLGTAFTVKSRTADNLLFHKALSLAQPGDIIVVDVQGDLVNSVTGEIMMREAVKNKLAGVVVDGAVRDSDALKEMAIPIYAAGVTPKGPYKDGPGEINVPVSCGGIVVNPGDILVGDGDGIVVISPEDAPGILEKAKAKYAKEQAIFKAIEEGTRDKSWVDKELKARGCEIIDDYYK